MIGRHMLKVNMFSLPNLLSGKMIVPELIQDDCTPDNISREVSKIFTSDNRHLFMEFNRLHRLLDLDSDSIRNRYNPFRRFYGLPDNGKRFSDILRMLLGECLFYFDRLPLVQDTGILQNILCAGLWAQFDKKYSDKKGPSDVSGSV